MSEPMQSRGGLLVRLAEAYSQNGEGQPCADDPLDIAREALRRDFPCLGDAEIERMARELSPDALQQTREYQAEAMTDLLRSEQADVLKLILFRIWESPKPRLSTGCLLLAVGIKPMGIASERALASQQQVSPEHVSNIVEEWQTVLRLPRTEFQKSAAAVEAARNHNRIRSKAA